MAARRAAKPHDAVLGPAASQGGVELGLDEPRYGHAAGFGTREEGGRMRAQQGMEGGLLGPTPAIARPATGQFAGGRRGRKSSAVHDREDRRHETVRSRARTK